MMMMNKLSKKVITPKKTTLKNKKKELKKELMVTKTGDF
eukprot:CAMPEP_0204821186 /NCGR_PEP_ID=MMETSP1018-20131115/4262_1 /ASSEMBLY_ACC=CAM_ASM_000518 /TAXON_ID=46462 /ORGANISM="Anophryoides haemophila, Strain AH6" /LENGTH=38 /DNA_ID= /DNA_START= /DNA_END= /DNA_ORIENTATION=